MTNILFLFNGFSKGGLENAALRLALLINKEHHKCHIQTGYENLTKYDKIISFKGHTKNLIYKMIFNPSAKFYIREYNSISDLHLDRSYITWIINLIVKNVLWRLSDGVIVNSFENVSQVLRYSVYQRTPVYYIPNYLSEKFTEYDNFQPKFLLYSGRFHKQKDVDWLLANYNFDDVGLKLVVRSDKPDQVIDLAYEQVKKGNVIVYNWNEAIPCSAQNTIFVLPTKYEGCPNALIEALMLGYRCLSSNTSSGIREHSSHIVGSEVFERNDYQDFIRKVHELKNITKINQSDREIVFQMHSERFVKTQLERLL